LRPHSSLVLVPATTGERAPEAAMHDFYRVWAGRRVGGSPCSVSILQQISVAELLAAEVFPAWSTALTVNTFAPLAVA
jgi:hypothetical protein